MQWPLDFLVSINVLLNYVFIKLTSCIFTVRNIFFILQGRYSFSTYNHACKQAWNTQHRDLRVARLWSSQNTTSAVVGSHASVIAEVLSIKQSCYVPWSVQSNVITFNQMWVTKCNRFSARKRTYCFWNTAGNNNQTDVAK